MKFCQPLRGGVHHVQLDVLLELHPSGCFSKLVSFSKKLESKKQFVGLFTCVRRRLTPLGSLRLAWKCLEWMFQMPHLCGQTGLVASH